MPLKVSIKDPFGGSFKVKGDSPDKVSETVNNLKDLAPKPVELGDYSLPRPDRTSVQLPSIPKKFRFRGSKEM